MTALANCLVLHRFLCQEFGYGNLAAMLGVLQDVPVGFSAGGESEFSRALYLNPAKAKVTLDRFADYDAKIGILRRRLRTTAS